ncbi:hypothetical protein [Nissabacter sp. SGAir0207]|uniref:hypothetical protein n=1 Tax=Nissabacter sp. SGAir0207 TaxID=2126321 RepID=UPI0010CD1522|nr:hypothetical protein [Nissabacter sp. SGAir0207]QCR35794.1 hypothetical protein C1N62_06690 [Nissabacter sp. SGAir0207]
MIIVIIIGAIAIAMRVVQDTEPANATSASVPSQMLQITTKRTPAVDLPPADTGAFKPQHICKAAIASIMQRKVKGIKATKPNAQGVVYLSYQRPQDGERFAYQCKLSSDYVVWSEKGVQSDRWLGSGEVDSVVMFTVNGNSLKISELYVDSTIEHTFKLSEL